MVDSASFDNVQNQDNTTKKNNVTIIKKSKLRIPILKRYWMNFWSLWQVWLDQAQQKSKYSYISYTESNVCWMHCTQR